MSTVSSSNADISVRYQRLAAEFSKVSLSANLQHTIFQLRSQFTVLKNGVIEEKAKNSQIQVNSREREQTVQEELSVKEGLSRKLKVENESLTFRNEQLARRVETLQTELEATTKSGKVSERASTEESCQKDKSKSKKEVRVQQHDGHIVGVLQEELSSKLRENEQLHLKV